MEACKITITNFIITYNNAPYFICYICFVSPNYKAPEKLIILKYNCVMY